MGGGPQRRRKVIGSGWVRKEKLQKEKKGREKKQLKSACPAHSRVQ